MASINRIVVFGAIGTLSLLTLVGCSSKPQASTTESSSVAATTSEQADYQSLLDVVAKTRAEVDVKNFDKAQTEFSQFEDSWQLVEDGIKDRSPDIYDAIEGDMDSLTGALKASDSEKASTVLQSLEASIQNASK